MNLRFSEGEGRCFHCGALFTFRLGGPQLGADDPSAAPLEPFEHDGLLWVRCPKCQKPNVVPISDTGEQ